LASDEVREKGVLVELALLFLRLGTTAFGGPAAHTAMMRREVVERRKWLTDEELLDLIGATNFIPGPNSTELAIHIGHRRAGFPGLVVAGVSFIAPAALITFAFAWLYVRFGRLPEAGAVLYGVKPVIVAVVVQALVGLGRSAVKTKGLAVVGVAAAVAAGVGVNELIVLFGAAAMYAAWAAAGAGPGSGSGSTASAGSGSGSTAGAGAGAGPASGSGSGSGGEEEAAVEVGLGWVGP
jgi:chromate transporter